MKMKKNLLLIGICTFSVLNAQVGINTQSPEGIVHINCLADSENKPDDDISVSANGNLGIGTTAPQQKLHIKSLTQGAIRITDGNQGNGKILSCIAPDGTASWSHKVGSWTAILKGGNMPYSGASISYFRLMKFNSSLVSNVNIGEVNHAKGYIIVPYTGTYRISLMGISMMNKTNNYFVAGYFAVRGSIRGDFWGPHSLGNNMVNPEQYFSYSTFSVLTKNEKVIVYANENASGYANAVKDLIFSIEFVQ